MHFSALLRPARWPWRQLASLAITLLLCGMVAGLWPVPGVAQLDRWWHDGRLALTIDRHAPPNAKVAIIDIDEASLQQLGHWPWPRPLVAELVSTLANHYQVSVIGFDVVFAEQAANPVLPGLQALASRHPALAPELAGLLATAREDDKLAAAVGKAPVVLGYYFDTAAGATRRSGQLPEPVFDSSLLAGIYPPAGLGYAANLPVLQRAAGWSAHFNAMPDVDGVSRRVPALIRHGDQLYDSLSIAMLRRLQGDMPLLPEFDDAGQLDALSVGSMRIPLDIQGGVTVPYLGGRGAFAYVSAADVLQRKLPVAALAGKAVLLGSTAPGLMDLRSTPLDAVYPGVEIHANMVAAALENRLPQHPATWLPECLLVLGLGLLLTFLLPVMQPLRGALLTGVLLAAIAGASLYAWQTQRYILPVAASMLVVALLYLLNASWGYISEARRRQQITSAFGSYVPPELVRKMGDDPQAFLSQMQGEHREMTVLFSDVRNFTRLSEGLPAAELAQLMNRYLSAQTVFVQQTGGTIDKYIGDAIMAFWGAPLPDASHAANAVQAALAMQDGMGALNAAFARRGWPALAIGVGINSGDMTVGNMGSDFRRAYTVMGDAVNLAARLEGLTKQYGVPILCGDGCRQACPDIAWREVDLIRAKGKQQAVPVWQPLGAGHAALAQLPAWQAVLAAYRAGEFAEAARLLVPLCDTSPEDGLYQTYAARLHHYVQQPPEHWDGVFEQTEK